MSGKEIEKQTRNVRTQIRSGVVREREMNEKEERRREIARGEALHLHGNVSRRRKAANGGVSSLKGEKSLKSARRYLRRHKCRHK